MYAETAGSMVSNMHFHMISPKSTGRVLVNGARGTGSAS